MESKARTPKEAGISDKIGDLETESEVAEGPVIKNLSKRLMGVCVDSADQCREAVEELRQQGQCQGLFAPVAVAIAAGDVDTVTRMLESGEAKVSYSAASHSYHPLLSVAAEHGTSKCAELLLQHRADIEAKIQLGAPLHVAIEHKNYETAKLLIRFKADVLATEDVSRCTPAHYAASCDNVELLEIMSARSKECLSAPNRNWRTPLHLAVMHDSLNVLTWLISQGVDLNPRDLCNNTPLHDAVSSSNKAASHALIKHGARCSQRCSACQLHVKLVSRLLKKSAEKQQQQETLAAFAASITEDDIRQTASICKKLLAEEERLTLQQETKAKAKAKQAVNKKQKKRLEQIREHLKTLGQVTATPVFRVAAEKASGSSGSKIRFDPNETESFMQHLRAGEDVIDGFEDEHESQGLNQEEIEEWLNKWNCVVPTQD